LPRLPVSSWQYPKNLPRRLGKFSKNSFGHNSGAFWGSFGGSFVFEVKSKVGQYVAGKLPQMPPICPNEFFLEKSGAFGAVSPQHI